MANCKGLSGVLTRHEICPFSPGGDDDHEMLDMEKNKLEKLEKFDDLAQDGGEEKVLLVTQESGTITLPPPAATGAGMNFCAQANRSGAGAGVGAGAGNFLKTFM